MPCLRLARALPLCLLTACYSGLTDADPGSSAGSASGGDAAEGGDDGADDGSVEQQCQGGTDVGPSRLVRLTREQFDNTVRDLLGIEGSPSAPIGEDEKVGPFSGNTVAPVNELTVEQYKTVAEELAITAVADLAALVPCEPANGDAACATQFITEFGRRAYRRPLTGVEADRYVALFEAGEDFAAGIRMLVQSMLQSPHFLYRVEFGEHPKGEITALTPYETASRLSYFLWNTMPDEQLLDTAEQDGLRTADDLRAQAERMLDDPRAADAIGSFHVQWLHVGGADKLDKDNAFFPAYDEALGAAMRADLAAVSSYVVQTGDGRLETLLREPMTFGSGALLDLYGVTPPAGHVPGDPIPLDDAERAGLLTNAAVLTVHAHANQTSPVARGALVREHLLCTLLPPPPPDVDNTPPTVDPDVSLREQFEQHRNNAACYGCHQLIDGIGFAFEHYDGEGRFRAKEAGMPVDASGELVDTEDIDGTFNGAVELSALLAGSQQVRDCVATQWFRFAHLREPTEADACSVATVARAFEDSDHSVRDLLLAVVTSEAFRYRREVSP